MTEHLSPEVVQRFHQQALKPGDQREIYNHITVCDPCRRRIVTPRIETIALQALLAHLLPDPLE